ncbi:unnamed protein product [Urochloa decumbens]|uniref:Uncharacterized protein n=1 Tax=Urochloa decumbens TaxID=240449 RepID=A0ABC8Y6S5_9POAL
MDGVGSLKKRVQSSSLALVLLAASILVPMLVESSNQKQVHQPTVIVAVTTVILGFGLFTLVFSIPHGHPPGPHYVAIKTLLHLCAVALVALSFSLSLMMRMNAAVAYSTLAAAGAYAGHRLWQCAARAFAADLEAYTGCEEEVHQLLETATGITSLLFGVWFGTAFFFFQNFPEEARDGRLLPSEYLIFFNSVAASLMFVKSVPRRLPPPPQPVCEIRALVYALVAGAVATALAIAASKVGRYAAALALAVGCAQWAKDSWGLPIALPACLRTQQEDGQGGEPAEALSQNIVVVSMTLLVAVLSYHAKDAKALSTLYDEAYVLVTTAAVVAALGWRLLTLPPVRTWAGVHAAAKVLAHAAVWLLLLSTLGLAGVMYGW